MNRIAIISDIHGNLPALEAVLADILDRGVSHIICLGDLAGKGPSSAEAVDRVRETCDQVIKGNWDHMLVEDHHEMLSWHQEKLGVDRLAFLKSLPMHTEFYLSGKLVRLCHASPNDVFHRTHVSSDINERKLLFEPTEGSNLPSDIVGYGDIHGAHVVNVDGKTIFNVGSVGNPLDMTKATYAMLEGQLDSKEESAFTITIVRVPYDIELAVAHAMETDMPERDLYIHELRTAIYRGRLSKATK